MDSNGGSTGGDVETTHHGIDIVDFTVDQRIGIIVFGELSLRTPVQKVAATAYQQSGGGNKRWKKDIYLVSYNYRFDSLKLYSAWKPGCGTLSPAWKLGCGTLPRH